VCLTLQPGQHNPDGPDTPGIAVVHVNRAFRPAFHKSDRPDTFFSHTAQAEQLCTCCCRLQPSPIELSMLMRILHIHLPWRLRRPGLGLEQRPAGVKQARTMPPHG